MSFISIGDFTDITMTQPLRAAHVADSINYNRKRSR